MRKGLGDSSTSKEIAKEKNLEEGSTFFLGLWGGESRRIKKGEKKGREALAGRGIIARYSVVKRGRRDNTTKRIKKGRGIEGGR